MRKMRFLPWLGAFAAMALLISGSGSASAGPVEVDFGSIAPSGIGSCTHVSGDGGYVCTSGQTFTASNGDVLTANGWTGQFATAANLT